MSYKDAFIEWERKLSTMIYLINKKTLLLLGCILAAPLKMT
jgi:hypothetical protein